MRDMCVQTAYHTPGSGLSGVSSSGYLRLFPAVPALRTPRFRQFSVISGCFRWFSVISGSSRLSTSQAPDVPSQSPLPGILRAKMAVSILSRRPLPGARGLRCLSGRSRRQVPAQTSSEPLEIPGLERVTYAERGYYVPGLAKPRFPEFRSHHDPSHYRSPPAREMALYREQPSYVYNPKCRLLGGVKQALWLTKSSLIEALPPRISSLSAAHPFPDHEQLVHNAISNACLWGSTEEARPREEYCPALLRALLHLCRSQTWRLPALAHRTFVESWQLAAAWHKDSTIYQVRGSNGLLMSAKTPLEPVASPEEVQGTERQVLESLYPLSPAIDLQEVNVYQEKDEIGFTDGFSHPHPHTVYLTEPCNTKARFLPEQLRAKMIMIAFGGAVAKAKLLFGEDVRTLPQPLVIQAVGTDGQLFHFMVLQLNTLDLESNDGIKNLVWMDGDQALYDTVVSKPTIKRKVVLVPAGITGFKPETFLKFWAMYLNGAV